MKDIPLSAELAEQMAYVAYEAQRALMVARWMKNETDAPWPEPWERASNSDRQCARQEVCRLWALLTEPQWPRVEGTLEAELAAGVVQAFKTHRMNLKKK